MKLKKIYQKVGAVKKINQSLFSNHNLAFKKALVFTALFSLIWFSHNYSPMMIIHSTDKLMAQDKNPFLNCEIIKIDQEFIDIRDDNDEEFLVELTEPFKEIAIAEGDKISFIGKITGRKESSYIVINIVANYYNHKYNALKKAISIPPIIIIFFLLLKNRKQYFS